MKYNYGLYIGRFQPFHKGHKAIVDKMLKECDKVIIAIGSAQEELTKENPFNYSQRRAMIQKVYPAMWDKIIILGINDRKNKSDDSSWGEYVFDCIQKAIDRKPDVVYQGCEDKHLHWFDTLNIPVVDVDRGILEISGTKVRNAILEDHILSYNCYMPSALHAADEYENMRMVLKYVELN